MTKAEIIEVANTLIGYGKVKEALEALSEYVKGVDKYSENDLLMQTATYNRNHRDYHNRLITKESYDMVMARLNYALTQITDRLPEKGNDVVADLTPPLPPEEAPKITRPGEEDAAANMVRKILFLSASPTDLRSLQLEDELRRVKDGLEAATKRDQFKLEAEPAVRVQTITKAMQKHSPEIVHFSGHGAGKQEGSPAGLFVQNDAGKPVLFPTDGLDMLFDLFQEDVKCVVLNACYSNEHAEAISKHGIYVVGMDEKIGDLAAVNFSVGFYQSLGEGRDFEFAFKIALINISPNLGDAHRPELWLGGKKIR